MGLHREWALDRVRWRVLCAQTVHGQQTLNGDDDDGTNERSDLGYNAML